MSNEVKIRSRAVSCFVIDNAKTDPRVLILKRVGEPLDGEWCQVAGRLEEGETAWQAALRELKEETGLVPVEFFTSNLCEQFYSVYADAIVVVPVFVAFVEDTPRVKLNHEHSEYQWMNLSDATKTLPFVGQRQVLRDIWDHFIDASPHPHLRIEIT